MQDGNKGQGFLTQVGQAFKEGYDEVRSGEKDQRATTKFVPAVRPVELEAQAPASDNVPYNDPHRHALGPDQEEIIQDDRDVYDRAYDAKGRQFDIDVVNKPMTVIIGLMNQNGEVPISLVDRKGNHYRNAMLIDLTSNILEYTDANVREAIVRSYHSTDLASGFFAGSAGLALKGVGLVIEVVNSLLKFLFVVFTGLLTAMNGLIGMVVGLGFAGIVAYSAYMALLKQAPFVFLGILALVILAGISGVISNSRRKKILTAIHNGVGQGFYQVINNEV